MTPERLRALVRAGERLSVEFKGEEARPLSDDALVEAVVCLANRDEEEVGWLLVGVEDDRRIAGARPRHPTAVATSDGKFVRRVIHGSSRPGCLPMTAVEVAARGASFRFSDVSTRPVGGTTWEDLSPAELARLREAVRRYRGDAVLLELTDFEMAKAPGMILASGEARQLTVCGLLLAGREEAICRHLPTHEVAFQVLRGLEVEVNEFFRLRLVERGLLERRGATRPVQYQLSGLVYRRLGMPAEYARARGPSAQEQVQRVLQHVREHFAMYVSFG